jgi:hypothetical protein
MDDSATPPTPVADQLAAIGGLSAALDDAGIEYWLFGAGRSTSGSAR